MSIAPAADMRPTSDQRWSVNLPPGTTATVNFGSRPIEQAADPASSDATSGFIGLVLGVAVLGGLGWLAYRQRKATS